MPHDTPRTGSVRVLRRRVPIRVVCLLVIVAGSAIWIGCRTAPVSGRRQLLIVPESQEIEMGKSAYSEVLGQEPPSRNPHYVELVGRVGRRIAAVAGRDDYEWEFRVIGSDEMNAFALPGGKVAFYEGIIPICQTEAGIAVVMSHEIAHALLRHGGERMSQVAVQQGLGKIVEIGSSNREETDRKLIMGAYGAVSKYGVMLPYSRKHESEADEVGLMLLARAGYDPEEAPRFWERFAAMKDGQAPPEFTSTHPSDDRRAANLRKLLPQAVELYARAPERYGTGEVFALTRQPPTRNALAPANFEREQASRTGWDATNP